MRFEDKLWVLKDADDGSRVSILPKMANRHGLIAGATGTGKTVSLKVLAESFSEMGVPVFLSDVKGDLAGCCEAGADSEDMRKRIDYFGLEGTGFQFRSFPVQFFDLSGERGLPLRTTVSEMGPVLLSRLLQLSDLQADILSIVFRIADEEKLLLLDSKDLRSMLQYIGENAAQYSGEYGNMSKPSLNAILRAVVALENAGGDRFFGEPAIDIRDFFRTDSDGRGFITILDAARIVQDPRLYSTFMLYLLSELFEALPEAGDPEKPKLVFFFDEAHLLFDNAPKALLEKIEQVVRLIRSKGIGIYFISQSPSDLPDSVLSQLGNKIQHALRAYTPAEEKKLKSAAQSFRKNHAFDTEKLLSELGTGEALVSFLDQEGRPEPVRRGKILPPESRMGPIEDSARETKIKASSLYSKYDASIDRDSAYEFLKRKTELSEEELRKALERSAAEKEEAERRAAEEKAAEKERAEAEKLSKRQQAEAEKLALREEKERERAEAKAAKEKEKAEAKAEKEKAKAEKEKSAIFKRVGKSTAGAIGRELGNSVGKSLLGNSVGRRIGGNVGSALGRGILETLFGK